MQIKNQRDFWSGVMFVAVGIGFAWGATNYSFGESAEPGPAYFPFGLGILMAILGAFVLFGSLGSAAGTAAHGGDHPVGRFAWKPLFLLLVAVAGFGFLLPRLGMIITLPALIIVTSMAGSEFRWKEAIVNATVLTVFSYLVFSLGLGLTIPLWPSFGG